MTVFKKLDLSVSVLLNEWESPLVVIDHEEVIFLNRCYTQTFGDFSLDLAVFFDSKESQKYLQQFLEGQLMSEAEFLKSMTLKDGSEQLFLWKFLPIPSALGKKVAMLKGVPQVDLFKAVLQPEASALSSKELLFVQSILKNSHDMVAILDQEGVYRFVSAAIFEKLGYSPEQIIGRSFFDFVDSGVIELDKREFQKVKETKQEVNLNFWMKNSRGEKVFLETFAKNLMDDPLIKGVLLSSRDITEFEKAKKSLEKRYELEKLINKISAKFVNVGIESLDRVFHESLHMLGKFEKADRAYIFLYHEDLKELEYIYEWADEGVESYLQTLKRVQLNDLSMTLETLKKGQILIISDISKMPEKYAKEKALYTHQGIQSVILIPIFSQNKLIGFFGLDAVKSKRSWHEKDEYVLRQLGDIYAGSLINKAIQKRLDRNEKLLASTEILAKSGSWRYSNSKNRLLFSHGLNRLLELPEDKYSANIHEFLSFVDKKQRRVLLKEIRLAVKEGQTVSGELKIKAYTNRIKFISYTIQTRKIPGTDSMETYGYCTDITHKKDAENYLQLQSQVLAQVNDPIFVTDVQLNLLYMNQAAIVEAGIRERKSASTKISALVESISVPDIWENIRSLNSAESYQRELNLKFYGQQYDPYDFSVKPFLNDDGQKIGYSFLIRNLSHFLKQEAIAQKAKMIVENSPAVIFTVNPNENFRIVYISENISQFGYQAEELIQSGKSILEIIHPDDVSILVKYHQETESSRGVEAFSGEYRVRKKDGTYRWVEDKTTEIVDSEGNILLHEGLLQDITERKRSREEILRSQERYRVLASNIPLTSVFLIDRDLRYIVAQGTNFEEWGIKAKDFEGKTLEEVHKSNLHEIEPLVLQAILKKEIAQKKVVFKNRVYDIMVKPILYQGEVEYALGILRDINEEYQAKENLRKSEEKYRKLVEESTEIIFSMAPDLTLTYLSPNIKQFLGYDASYVIGRKLTYFLSQEDKAALEEGYQADPEFLAKNQYLEFKIRRSDGELRVLASNGKLVLNEDGQFTYNGIARDITKLREAQRELFLAKEKAEQASMVKSQFLSIMSHEIRTPMNAVIGMAHLLMEDHPRPDQLENLKTLQFSAENLLALINDILDYTKIDSGKIELETVGLELETVINRIIHSYSYQAREKNLRVIFDSDPTIPTKIIGDPVRLGQVINNLLSNAVKFTDTGYIKISTKKIAENEEDVQVHFEVEDSGIGIPKGKQKQVFEAFTQASAETTRKYGGTGLGLAIVKKLLELLGSDIGVMDNPLGGTIFYFTLSFKKSSVLDKESEDREVLDPTRLHEASILVAEDNLVNQVMIKKFLIKWGVKNIRIANDGAEAIRIIQKENFDLILLDLQMPEKDGFQVAKFVRSLDDEEKSKLPIIALTASSLIEVKEQLESVGMNDYIPKPFNPDHLYAKLIRYLQL